MLFSSYTFLLLFLPTTVTGFFAAARFGRKPALLWLLAASLFFYGYWSPSILALIGISMAFNYVVGRALEVSAPVSIHRKFLLCIGVLGNLSLLGYYKYADFVYGTYCLWSGVECTSLNIVLPLGISFFTFQQIGYVVDRYRGTRLQYDLVDYLLFVVYFPQLIAGPIVCHRDIIPQFHSSEILRPRAENFAIGLSIFVIGLLKKSLIAEELGDLVGSTFAFAAGSDAPTFAEAWLSLFAYTFQLYFDFSGYSDMAVGLGRIFGLRMPLNFDSPYKATSIIDFWRRWHITLSVFLRDHLYIPLGGGRCSTLRRYANLFITMVLGGLWHGAGWGFVLWGAVHGALLIINHAWRAQRIARLSSRLGDSLFYRLLGGGLTFLVVSLAWVLFRASDLNAASHYYLALFDFYHFDLTTKFDHGKALFWVTAAGLGVWLVPNTHQLFQALEASVASDTLSVAGNAVPVPKGLDWRFSLFHACAITAVAVASLLNLGRVQEFLYFQF